MAVQVLQFPVIWWKMFITISSSWLAGGRQRISILLWLTSRFCSPAVVPYEFSLWKLSPSLCPSLSWHQIFISIKLSHCSTSKLVDRLHSYKVMQEKLYASRMMWAAVVNPDCVRQLNTNWSFPCFLSPSLSCDLQCSLSLPGSLCCQLRVPSSEKQH